MKIKEIKKERKNASFKDPLNFQNDTCAIQNDRHFPYTLHPVKKYYCKKYQNIFNLSGNRKSSKHLWFM